MTKVLFVDFETTGLDVEKDPILEVGAILYDLKAEKELAEVHSIGGEPGVRFEPRIDRVVYEMHTKNGLFDSLGGQGHSMWENAILRNICVFGMTKGECMMAGRTPSFDRRLIEKHAPRLHAFLSHRMIDVSTLTQLTKAWGPEKEEDPTRKNDPHRALEDCREAIATLLKYRQVFSSFDLYPERPNKPPT